MRHTPGPWTTKCEHAQPDDRRVIYGGPNGYHVAYAADFNRFDRDAEADANARLIAAAPEMRDELLAALAEHAAEQHMGSDCPCAICDRRRALLATIDGGAS